MINYKKTILLSRVNTILGTLLLGSWMLGCGMAIWNASFGTNPLTESIASAMAAAELTQ